MQSHMASERGSARSGPPAMGWRYDDDESVYVDWVHRFVERLSRRLPDESVRSIMAAAEQWAHHFDHVEAEEAAEIAAMWWDRHHGWGAASHG